MAESGAKKAARGMLIGMKENADEKDVEGKGKCRVRQAPSLAAASSLFESLGLGWVQPLSRVGRVGR